MIAKLKGIIDSVGEDWVIIDVGGVGYLVYGSRRMLTKLPVPGESTELLIETHMREDHIHLFGFMDSAERDLYRLLTSVQGVGAKMALAVLSVMEPAALLVAIASEDKAALTKAHKVGPKLAARITNELKDKIGALPAGLGKTSGDGKIDVDNHDFQDAVSALTNLGYGQSEAYSAVASAQRKFGSDCALDDLVRSGLKELGA